MMGRRKKQYDDDDGRTIVDMSQVSPSPAFLPRRPENHTLEGQGRGRQSSYTGQDSSQEGGMGREQRPWEDNSLSAKERFLCVMGALKATLLIALAYLAGFAALIWLLVSLWD